MTEKMIIRQADFILTMDDKRNEFRNQDIRIANGEITEIGKNLLLADETREINARGCVVTPGLVNTHHHLFQTLTKAVPEGQDALLFGWLKTLYPIWSKFGPEEIRVSAMTGLAELALSGCSLTSDHLYLYPNGSRLDDTIDAAKEIGIRFSPTRGSMSIGESDGGLPPDSLVEKENLILEDCIRVIDKYHDPNPASFIQIGIAPCSPFSVSQDLMRDSALLARDKNVYLHTHLAENDEDVAYSIEKFGCRPGQYAEDLGWVGNDVWHAHCVKLDTKEQKLFSKSQTGISHCPCSNCRLGSGIAPIKEMRGMGIPIGLGVDGSASNDSGNLITEARQAMLMQRVSSGADAMSSREALEIATRGGADILGRPECGRIAIGKRADIAIWDVSGLESAGSWDPAAILLTGPNQVKHLIVDGKFIVEDSQLLTSDLAKLINLQNKLAKALF